MSEPILAATSWRTNAEMILACHRLGYLNGEDLVADVTAGRQLWWRKWRPNTLVCHDLYTLDGVDFTDLPEPDETFDVVAYDPAYVSMGGRETTTIPDFYDRYGLKDAPSTPAELQLVINLGTTEAYRVLKRGGRLLVKSCSYVSSGKLWPGTHYTLSHALSLGLRLQDQLMHVGRARPQPKRTRKDGLPVRQHHARQNYSVLSVLTK